LDLHELAVYLLAAIFIGSSIPRAVVGLIAIHNSAA
jgi:hypothetical protein